MDESTIVHNGLIRDIDDKNINVEIINTSICSACHAKSVCTASDMTVKTVKVNKHLYKGFQKGEEVKVLMKRSMGFRAVWLSYVLPLCILMFLLLLLPLEIKNELVVAMISLGVLAIYYLAIHLFNNTISKKFVFVLEKL